jgi:hypothetical protein
VDDVKEFLVWVFLLLLRITVYIVGWIVKSILAFAIGFVRLGLKFVWFGGMFFLLLGNPAAALFVWLAGHALYACGEGILESIEDLFRGLWEMLESS